MTYQNMPARQLRKVAPQIGLTGASRMKQADIVSWIDQHVGGLTDQQKELVGLTVNNETAIVERKRRTLRQVVADSTVKRTKKKAERTSDDRQAGSMTRGERDALRRRPVTVYDPAAVVQDPSRPRARSRAQRRSRVWTYYGDDRKATPQVSHATKAQRTRGGLMQPAVTALSLKTGLVGLHPQSTTFVKGGRRFAQDGRR